MHELAWVISSYLLAYIGIGHLYTLENGLPIGRLFLGHGRTLRALEQKYCVTGCTEGPFGPLSKNSKQRGVNEALIVRLSTWHAVLQVWEGYASREGLVTGTWSHRYNY